MRRDEAVRGLTELEEELVASRAAVLALDEAQYTALREHHLLQAKEFPLVLSPPPPPPRRARPVTCPLPC